MTHCEEPFGILAHVKVPDVQPRTDGAAPEPKSVPFPGSVNRGGERVSTGKSGVPRDGNPSAYRALPTDSRGAYRDCGPAGP